MQVCLKSNTQQKWFLDSGCSRHMTGDPSNFTLLKKKEGGSVTFGDNSQGKIIGIGNVGKKNFTLSNVLLVEGLKHNLISISQLCDNGFSVKFAPDSCKVMLNGKPVFTALRSKNVYSVDFDSLIS